MRRLFTAAFLLIAAAGCRSSPPKPYEDARLYLPVGETAEHIQTTWKVTLYGPWDEVQLRILQSALEMFPDKDLSGLEFYKLPRTTERGAKYDNAKIVVYEVIPDVIVHELGHAVHARAPGYGVLKSKLLNTLDFTLYWATDRWEDGSQSPRRGFVTPYASRNVDECVAETITALKAWSWWSRGPLLEVDWTDPLFDRVYDILDEHSLLGERDREALKEIRKRP